MPQKPLVSIIVPVCNVEAYLPQCLDALLEQTLENIEIIALDDGSTDGSLGILREYGQRDGRLRVIAKDNEGYGATINRGVAEARADYIGIVESDDYPEPDMFQKLHSAAVRFDADLVKCDFFDTFEDGERVRGNLAGLPHGVVFDAVDEPQIMTITPSIWAALYRRKMIDDAAIACRPTPGAAFQDTSFALKCFASARRCVMLGVPLLHYRRDNPNSSTLSTDKVQTVADEFAEARAFMARDKQRYNALIAWQRLNEWNTHSWDLTRVAPEARVEYLGRMKEEFSKAREDGEIDLGLFDECAAERLEALLEADGDSLVGFDPSRAASPLMTLDVHERARKVKVSVVIGAYNNERYIKRCVRSCLRQTHGDVEVVCVDDASCDATYLILRKLAASDARVKLVHLDENVGTHATRLEGVLAATGDIVTFLDGDDELSSEACAHMARAFAEEPYDIVQFGMRVLAGKGATKAQVRNMEEWVRPPSGSLFDDEIVRSAFVDLECCANVAGKAFRTELARAAFKSLGGVWADYGEDGMEYFAIACRARTYRGLPGSKLYRYHFGDGPSSRRQMTETQFQRPLRIRQAIDGTRDFLERSGALDYRAEAYGSFRDGQLHALVRTWDECVRLQDKDACLKQVLASWPRGEVEGAVCLRGRSAAEALLRCLDPGDSISFEHAWAGGYAEAERAVREEYEGSASYKVGRAVTSVPRRLLRR